MAQKIRVNTVLELDGTEYNITIAPITKKTGKKIQKAFNKEKEASQGYIDLERELSDIDSEIEITQELLDATEDKAKRIELIMEKKALIADRKPIKVKLENERTATFEKMSDAQEKMYESMFDEMVSGDDAEALKAYVNDYSFELVVTQVSKVYEKELEGK